MTYPPSPGAGQTGDSLAGAPRQGASLWSTYRIWEGALRGFAFGAGICAGQHLGGLWLADGGHEFQRAAKDISAAEAGCAARVKSKTTVISLIT